jgi:hypothetical protein
LGKSCIPVWTPSLLMRLITQVTSLDTSSMLLKHFPWSGFFGTSQSLMGSAHKPWTAGCRYDGLLLSWARLSAWPCHWLDGKVGGRGLLTRSRLLGHQRAVLLARQRWRQRDSLAVTWSKELNRGRCTAMWVSPQARTMITVTIIFRQCNKHLLGHRFSTYWSIRKRKEFDLRVTVHHDKILIIKPTRCTNFSNFFWNETVHVSDSSSVHHQEFFTVYTAVVHVIHVCWQLASCQLKFILEWNYMFQTVPLSIIRIFFHCTHSNGIHHTGLLTACECIRMFHPDPARKLSATCMMYTIAVCTVKNSWWWTEELSEKCRVSFQSKFEKLVHQVGFIVRCTWKNLQKRDRRICQSSGATSDDIKSIRWFLPSGIIKKCPCSLCVSVMYLQNVLTFVNIYILQS